jgi:sulfur-carrier protein adenylyltransferase/sulfurtransferase
LLSGKGFKEVYNLAGGIKAWEGHTAAGPAEMGMAYFSGNESPRETIQVAYGMEVGLGEFYRKTAEQIEDSQAADILIKLADIEEKHQLRLLELYGNIVGETIDKATFEKDVLASVMEGGFTTEEFLDQYRSYMQTVVDVLNIAMMLETQAMDLYMRYADKSADEETQKILAGLAEEEKGHLKRLGDLLDEKTSG